MMTPEQMRQVAGRLRESRDAPNQAMAPDVFMASLGIHALADAIEVVADAEDAGQKEIADPDIP